MDSVTFGGPMDRVLLLRTMPVFEGLRSNQLAAIGQHATERFVARDTDVALNTALKESVLLVVEGELERTSAESPQVFARGDSIGLVDTLAGSGTNIELKARLDTVLLELDWDTQLDICEEYFAVMMSYISFLSSQLVERTQRIDPIEAEPVPLIAAQNFGEVLDLNERLLLLSRSSAFSHRCLDALSELAQQGEEIRLPDGQRVWSVDQEADYFLVLASGALRLEDASGRSSIYRAGTAAGMAETLSRYNRRFSAVCIEPTVALRIEIGSFMDVLEDHFDLSLDVLGTLASRLLSADAVPERNPSKT